MPALHTVLQFRHYVANTVESLIGSQGELIVKIDTNDGLGELTLHNGTVAGGIPISAFRVNTADNFFYVRNTADIVIGKTDNHNTAFKLDISGNVLFSDSLCNDSNNIIDGSSIICLGKNNDLSGQFIYGIGDTLVVENGNNVVILGSNISSTHENVILIGKDISSIENNSIVMGSNLLYITSNTDSHHIIPNANDMYDLGSPTKYWRAIYVKTLYANTIVGGTSGGDVKPRYYKYTQSGYSSDLIELPASALRYSTVMKVDQLEWIPEDDYEECVDELGYVPRIRPLVPIPNGAVVLIRYIEA